MPGEASLPAIPRLRADCPGTAVVVLTAQRDPSYAGEALRLGATGYVPKEAAGRHLLEAIRTVAGGGTYLEPELGARLAATTAAAAGAAPELTARELEVLRWIARGLTNREIAERLFLSVRTIESHRARIQRKLGRSRRSDLVDYALERGLVEAADLDRALRLSRAAGRRRPRCPGRRRWSASARRRAGRRARGSSAGRSRRSRRRRRSRGRRRARARAAARPAA